MTLTDHSVICKVCWQTKISPLPPNYASPPLHGPQYPLPYSPWPPNYHPVEVHWKCAIFLYGDLHVSSLAYWFTSVIHWIHCPSYGGGTLYHSKNQRGRMVPGITPSFKWDHSLCHGVYCTPVNLHICLKTYK